MYKNRHEIKKKPISYVKLSLFVCEGEKVLEISLCRQLLTDMFVM